MWVNIKSTKVYKKSKIKTIIGHNCSLKLFTIIPKNIVIFAS